MRYRSYEEYEESLKREIGKNIGHYRRDRGLTQEKLASMLGIGVKRLSSYEVGDTAISAARLARICKILDVAPDDMIDLNV